MSNKKKKLLLFIFLILESTCYAQEFRLQIIGNSNEETKIIDSLNYQTKHKNVSSINDKVEGFLKKAYFIGYIEVKTFQLNKINDSTFQKKINLGQRIKKIILTIPDLETIGLLRLQKNTIEIPYPEIETFLIQTIHLLEDNGYVFAKAKLKNIIRQQSLLLAELDIQKNSTRKINTIVIKKEEKSKFPKGHLTQINRKYKNKLFNLKSLEQINSEFNRLNFVNQLKYPEFLVTQDTTKVFVYLEKKNSNTFDGFIGFSNNENRFTLNGYLDIQLENIINKGEQIQIFWKSDGNDQKTFKASLALPYLFNSPIGIQTDLQIFRQDSTFQNTKTTLGLNYRLKNNSEIKIGYNATQSSVIQNSNSNITGFNNNFITIGYENKDLFIRKNSFTPRFSFNALLGAGKRLIETESKPTKQIQIEIKNIIRLEINTKNSFHVNNHNYYLSSKIYVENELHRFGGFKSVRGFRENSLSAFWSSAFITEYRHALTNKFYVHTIADLAYFKTNTLNVTRNNQLIGVGLGFGAQTKNGLLRIALASGALNSQRVKTENGILHLSYNINF
jgi:hemolysin activation/secretion protein